jgi:hypothetical protein
MDASKQSIKLYGRSALPPQRVAGWAIFMLLGLNMVGCNTLPADQYKASALDTVATDTLADSHMSSRMNEQHEIEYGKLLAEKQAQQHEIERLQKLLAEKEAYIRSQEARQQDQAKTLQETSNQAAHAQVKLRRLATRPAAASTIAEVEMVMENLKSSPIAGPELVLKTQAQHLLDAAATSYAEDNYAAAMDYAGQAREFINMMRNNRARKATEPHQVTVLFQVPIPLQATANSNLRQKPDLRAPVLSMLKKGTTMTAEAYRGDWLQIVTNDGQSGWVLNTLVEAQVGKPIDMVAK